MYKALIADIDGTVVPISSFGEEVTPTTQTAVKKAHKQKKLIACATGRQWQIARPVIKKLGITAPCIIEGGTQIIDPTSERILWEKALAPHTSAQLLALLKKSGASGHLMHSFDTSHQPFELVTEIPDNLRFIYLLAVPEAMSIAIINHVNQTGLAVAHMTPSWYKNDQFDIHLTHPQATKEHAIYQWQKLHSIAREETIGMGDSGNDIPIFQASGLKVAVANATPDLLALADYVAPSVQDRAFEHVIDRFLLL